MTPPKVTAEIIPNPPDSFVLGPHHYRISTDANEFNAVQVAERTGLAGRHDPTSLTIHIEPVMVHDMRCSTLLHELIHGILYHGGITSELEKETEERICDSIAVLLLGVLRDNPDLVTYLTA